MGYLTSLLFRHALLRIVQNFYCDLSFHSVQGFTTVSKTGFYWLLNNTLASVFATQLRESTEEQLLMTHSFIGARIPHISREASLIEELSGGAKQQFLHQLCVL